MDLFDKCVVIPLSEKATIEKSRYYTHLQEKSFLRCIVLLIPILGNIVVGIYDFVNRAKVLKSEGGDLYIGEVRDGRPHGKGKIIYSDGNGFKGEFRDGKMHGKGTVRLNGKIKMSNRAFEGEILDLYNPFDLWDSPDFVY